MVTANLGANITQQDKSGQILLTQNGLIDQIIESLDLQCDSVNLTSTPAEWKPLTKDTDGTPWNASFSYASVIGMLLYLAGHTQPDIVYAINSCT
ncbi:hypothetical protein ACHAXS_001592 [Conticribra weissflogii]